MRYFAKPSSLERLSLEARILYTGFSLFMLLGYASSAWLYSDDALGVSGGSARNYYLGAASPAASREAAAPSVAASPGPMVELPANDLLPPDSRREAMRFAKPPRQVMETFHFHLLTVPVCLLIIAHLFMMCRLSTRIKAWTIAIASVMTLIHVALPPLIRFVSPSLAALVFPSAAGMGLFWLFMTARPVYEMWRPAGLPGIAGIDTTGG